MWRGSGIAANPDPAVFDAGPLIYLDALGYLDAVREMHEIIIPDTVADELSRRPGAPGSIVPASEWGETRMPEPHYVRRVEAGPPSVDAGERAVIAVALELGIMAVMDERRGRLRARRLGVSLTGAVGVLLNLHLEGRARRTFAEDLEALDEAGMYLTVHPS